MKNKTHINLPFSGPRIWLPRGGRLLFFVFLFVGLAGCVHDSKRTSRKTSTERQLLLLEADFVRFTSTEIKMRKYQGNFKVLSVLNACENDVKNLESLRARYLALVGKAVTDQQRLLAMIRLAELHLDFGARLRRVDYPQATLTDAQRNRFDQKLSNAALPYEAVGLGILNQIIDYSTERNLSGRMTKRAHMYAALHGAPGGQLTRQHISTLKIELTAKGPYRSPRRLLETGRIGRWAARR